MAIIKKDKAVEESRHDRKARQKLFGQVLKDMNLVTEVQIQEGLTSQQGKTEMLGATLVRLKYVTEEQIQEAISAYLGMKRVDIKNLELPQEAIDMIPSSIAQIYRVLPVSFKDGVLEIAQENALKMDQLHDITLFFGYKIRGIICNYKDIGDAIEKYYPPGKYDESIEDLLGAVDIGNVTEVTDDKGAIEVDLESLKKMADVAPVKSFVNTILVQAIKEKVSDIHFEPFEDEFFVRYRVDNVLYKKASPPIGFGMGITTRIKVMSNLNITERRVPQDGRIKLRIKDETIEFRVSCLPTKFGESIVLRIFDKSVASVHISDLGMQKDKLDVMMDLLKMPNGIVLVTGPTGSGKTSTLYSVLNFKNTVDVKIITTEDPVENDIEGIMQIPINPNVGTTFASSLRAILRQDPDIILVGEIRDEETAQIAVEAALTGHMVFSTLHTNDSPSTITRLVDMGIQPFMISATVRAVISQRLLRRICPECKEELAEVDETLLNEFDLTKKDVEGKKFYHGKGCGNCRNSGYKGRLAIFELMEMNDEISKLVIALASVADIRDAARRNGMYTLRESGLYAVYNGITTLEQVIDETAVD